VIEGGGCIAQEGNDIHLKKVLCNLLEELFNLRHAEFVISWILKINRVSQPLLEELCIISECVLLV
jgi:hypothetical protein